MQYKYLIKLFLTQKVIQITYGSFLSRLLFVILTIIDAKERENSKITPWGYGKRIIEKLPRKS